MNKGDLYMAYLDPVVGSEQGGRRPVLIISGNGVNKLAKTVIICPLTTAIKNYEGDVILDPTEENGLQQRSEVLNIHIKSISKKRIKSYIGRVSEETVQKTIQGVNYIFKY